MDSASQLVSNESKLIEEKLENIIVHVFTRFGYAEVDCKQFVKKKDMEKDGETLAENQDIADRNVAEEPK